MTLHSTAHLGYAEAHPHSCVVLAFQAGLPPPMKALPTQRSKLLVSADMLTQRPEVPFEPPWPDTSRYYRNLSHNTLTTRALRRHNEQHYNITCTLSPTRPNQYAHNVNIR